MIFLTPSASQFANSFKDQLGNYTLGQFHDGDLFLKLDSQLDEKKVTVITATNAPARHFLELFFLLDTLKQEEADIHLIFTYFGYERQDHPEPHVARAPQVIANCLTQFAIKKMTIIHPHSERLHNFMSFSGVIPFDLYEPIVREHKIDIIIAPDKGARKACEELAHKCHCAIGFIEKERISPDQIHDIAIHADAAGKKALIFDDIISTGSTIMQAADLLKQNGADTVYAIATHNFLAQPSIDQLMKSQVEHLWVTNTVPSMLQAEKLTILEMGAFLKNLACR